MRIQVLNLLENFEIISGFASGSDSQGESSSEHSIQEETNNRDVLAEIGEVPARDKEDLLVCRL